MGNGVGRAGDNFGCCAAPYAQWVDVKEAGSPWYQQGEIQPWDFITSQGLGFLEGNIIKYITRYRHKNGIADLEKAKHYLEKLIEVESIKEQEIRDWEEANPEFLW